MIKLIKNKFKFFERHRKFIDYYNHIIFLDIWNGDNVNYLLTFSRTIGIGKGFPF